MAMGKGHATLGHLTFRLDPDQITYPYQIDYSVIDTLGGQVVQVLGSTIGDITISGSFGQDHQHKKESWELAESFHASIKQMIDAQSLLKQGQSHKPVRFTYQDGLHDWDFNVLIKSIQDADGGAVAHRTGKFSYHYTLTLFLVDDSSLALKKITTDKFIARISNGMGWKASSFNGSMSAADAISFIQSNSTDGTFNGYIVKLLGGPAGVDNGPTGSVGPSKTGSYKAFFDDVLTQTGLPVTTANEMALAKVTLIEGVNTRFNPVNSVVPTGTSTSFNSVGVQDYKNYQQGVEGTVKLLQGDPFNGIRAAMKQNNQQAVLTAFSDLYSTWGSDPNFNGINSANATKLLNQTMKG